MNEKLDVLDHLGRKTGRSIDRLEAHVKGIWHASTHLWFINSDNMILLQKRSPEKKLYPGLWVAPVSGHIPSGKNPVEVAITEAEEEMNIGLTEDDFFYLSTIKGIDEKSSTEFIEREFVNVFVSHNEFVINLDLKNDEVDGYKWFGYDEFRQLVDSKSQILVPVFQEYEIIISYIKHNRI